MQHGKRAVILGAVDSARQIGLLFTLVFGFFCTGCSIARDTENLAATKDIPLATLDGQATSLARFRGKFVLAHFWATWCATCRDELASLNELKQSIDNLTVIAIAVEDEFSAVREFIERERLTLPVLLDLGYARGTYDISNIPFTVLLDPTGRIRPFIDPATGEVVSDLTVARAWATPTAIERIRRSLR